MSSKSKPHKSWQEKLADSKGLPKVEKITAKQSKRWGTGTIVIPAPKEVDEIMKKVPKGKLVIINQIRAILAQKHGATICCPITTGIFACIAARAAEEAKGEEKKDVILRNRKCISRNSTLSSNVAEYTPYWRTLKSGGELNEKYPGGIDNLKALLKAEGHTIIQKGKKYIVKDFEKYLVNSATESLLD